MSRWQFVGPLLSNRAILGVVALLLSGCGQAAAVPYADQRCAVHGQVLLNGEPLQAGSISFESYDEGVKGMTVTGLIMDGSFEIKAQNGPVAGQNRFDISVEGASGPVAGTSGMIEIQQSSKEPLNFAVTTQSQK